MKRHLPKGLTVATNTEDILTEINSHAYFADIQKPNQTHEQYVTYDISCNEDFALHAKYHEWEKIFTFFKEHPIAFGTMATKTVPTRFLSFNPNKKIRIRFSLMPQKVSSIVEPNTSLIIDRIKAINAFIEAGYDIHVNFSPVIFYEGWLDDYKLLFMMLDDYVEEAYKKDVLAEVIFLTHNVKKHYYNLSNNIPGEELLWNEEIQESKTSQYGGDNLRYKVLFKRKLIEQFKQLHSEVIHWNTIRYIF